MDQLTRYGATLNLFMLGEDPGLRRFVDAVARRSGGRVFTPDAEDLGRYVVSDYLRSRRSLRRCAVPRRWTECGRPYRVKRAARNSTIGAVGGVDWGCGERRGCGGRTRSVLAEVEAGGFGPAGREAVTAERIVAHLVANDELMSEATEAVLAGSPFAYYDLDGVHRPQLDALVAGCGGLPGLATLLRSTSQRLCALVGPARPGRRHPGRDAPAGGLRVGRR